MPNANKSQVRCDAHEQYPNPCTRCMKKKSECLLQPDFKRTSKRRRMMELEQEMEALRKNMGGTTSDSSFTEPSSKRIATGSLLELSDAVSHYHHKDLPAPLSFPKDSHSSPTVAMDPPPVIVDDVACQPKSLEGVTLSSETIQNLFKEFVSKYHPFLPVVDVSKGPEKIYRLCPSLFWTIMTVASRRYDQDGGLMMKLAPLLKNCLAEITISPSTRFVTGESSDPTYNVASVYSVQAFLIYTMWPPLTSSISADSSWNAAGVAIFSGIRVGLHCPGYSRDFGRVKADNPSYPKIAEQIRTWVCCNVVSQAVATVFGFPSFTSFDASVVSACSKDSGVDVSESIRQMMMIQQLENEVEKTLNSNAQDPLGLSELSERLSLIQIMSRKLDELEMKIGTMDDYRRFLLLAARMHLMTYYFLDNGGFSTLQLQKGLVQAYNSALALLHHTNEASQRNSDFMRYLPGMHVQLLWQSTAIIIKVYHSSFAEFVDAGAGKEYYFKTIEHLSNASILKHDVAYRGAEIMQQIWQLFGDLARRNAATSRISIRTRMAASVFFDTLWTMREECGIRSVAPAVLKERNIENHVPSPMSVYGDVQSAAAAAGGGGGGGTSEQQSSQSNQQNQHQGLSHNTLAQQTSQKDPRMPVPVHQQPQAFNMGEVPLFDWDVDLAWRDVDLMMTDFGFNAEEVSL